MIKMSEKGRTYIFQQQLKCKSNPVDVSKSWKKLDGNIHHSTYVRTMTEKQAEAESAYLATKECFGVMSEIAYPIYPEMDEVDGEANDEEQEDYKPKAKVVVSKPVKALKSASKSQEDAKPAKSSGVKALEDNKIEDNKINSSLQEQVNAQQQTMNQLMNMMQQMMKNQQQAPSISRNSSDISSQLEEDDDGGEWIEEEDEEAKSSSSAKVVKRVYKCKGCGGTGHNKQNPICPNHPNHKK
jgi:hypothetical protein